MNLPAVYDRTVEAKEREVKNPDDEIYMRNWVTHSVVNEIWNNKVHEDRLNFGDLWEVKQQLLRLGCTYGFAVQSAVDEWETDVKH